MITAGGTIAGSQGYGRQEMAEEESMIDPVVYRLLQEMINNNSGQKETAQVESRLPIFNNNFKFRDRFNNPSPKERPLIIG